MSPSLQSGNILHDPIDPPDQQYNIHLIVADDVPLIWNAFFGFNENAINLLFPLVGKFGQIQLPFEVLGLDLGGIFENIWNSSLG